MRLLEIKAGQGWTSNSRMVKTQTLLAGLSVPVCPRPSACDIWPRMADPLTCLSTSGQVLVHSRKRASQSGFCTNSDTRKAVLLTGCGQDDSSHMTLLCRVPEVLCLWLHCKSTEVKAVSLFHLCHCSIQQMSLKTVNIP